MYAKIPPRTKNVPKRYKRPLSSSKYRSACDSFRELYGDTMSYLYNPKNGANIVMAGTVHFSSVSANQVTQLMRTFKPTAVMVELDEKRAHTLMREFNSNRMFYGFSLSGLISSFLALIGIKPGMDFAHAIRDAPKTSTIILADYRSELKLEKLLSDMSKGKSKLDDSAWATLGKFLPSGFFNLEKLKSREFVALYGTALHTISPSAHNALIVQRDDNMARVLYGLKGTVVAVVGMGHIIGIEQKFNELVEANKNQHKPFLERSVKFYSYKDTITPNKTKTREVTSSMEPL